MKKGIHLGLYALILTCTACSERNAESPTGNKTESKEMTQQTQKNSTNKSSLGETLDQQVSSAMADLANRTGIAEDAIMVKNAQKVTWRSGALGCPKEGMNYTQAIVPGILVLLEANGSIYHYHGRVEGRLFFCPKERVGAPGYGPGQAFM